MIESIDHICFGVLIENDRKFCGKVNAILCIYAARKYFRITVRFSALGGWSARYLL